MMLAQESVVRVITNIVIKLAILKYMFNKVKTYFYSELSQLMHDVRV